VVPHALPLLRGGAAVIKDARCAFVTGRRGSGKTTLVQQMVERSRRVVVFDPLGQYGREFHWPMATNIRELHDFVARFWRDPFRIAYTAPGDFVTELHRLALYLWEAMRPYDTGRDRHMLVLVVEEMNLSVPVHKLPATRRGFERLVLQGRHRGIEIIGVSQRPALVSADFRSSVAETYVLPLGIEDHDAFGRRFRDEVARLQPHQWLRFAEGAATRGENRPAWAAGKRGGRRSA